MGLELTVDDVRGFDSDDIGSVSTQPYEGSPQSSLTDENWEFRSNNGSDHSVSDGSTELYCGSDYDTP